MIGEKGEDGPSDRTVVGCKEAKILSQGKEKHSEFYSSRGFFALIGAPYHRGGRVG